jgi:hypothetical protein
MGLRVVSVIAVTTSLLLTGAAFTQPRPGQLPPAGGGAPRGQPTPPPPQQRQAQPQQQQQQQQITPKPYKPVSLSAPAPVKDPAFETLRKQIGAVAEKKDRRALAAMIAPNFFWMGENGDQADKKKTGIDNLAKAVGLDGKDTPGWEMLASASNDPTGMPFPDRKDTICAPADPVFKAEEFEALTKATGTSDGDWGFPTQPGLEVHSSAQPNSPVVEKLGMHFVLVLPEDSPGNQQNPMLRIVAPSGKTGFVPVEAINPLGSDQVCYTKDASGWKISGFIGGGGQQQ